MRGRTSCHVYEITAFSMHASQNVSKLGVEILENCSYYSLDIRCTLKY